MYFVKLLYIFCNCCASVLSHVVIACSGTVVVTVLTYAKKLKYEVAVYFQPVLLWAQNAFISL